MVAPLHPKLVRDAIEKSLGEWGCTREKHEEFDYQAIKTAIAQSRPTYIHCSANEELLNRITALEEAVNSMPRDPVNAIIHVLAKELEEGDFYDDTEDTSNLRYPPFHSRTRSQFKKVVFIRRPEKRNSITSSLIHSKDFPKPPTRHQVLCLEPWLLAI